MKPLSQTMIDTLLTTRHIGYASDGQPTMQALVARGLARFTDSTEQTIQLTPLGVRKAQELGKFPTSYSEAMKIYRQKRISFQRLTSEQPEASRVDELADRLTQSLRRLWNKDSEDLIRYLRSRGANDSDIALLKTVCENNQPEEAGTDSNQA